MKNTYPPKIAKELEHLNSEEIEELYARYIGGQKNADLIEEYQIQTSANKLITLFPPVEHQELLCPYCNIPMFSKRKSKTSYLYTSESIICLSCDHTYHEDGACQKCNCNQCKQIRFEKEQAIIQENKEKIRNIYSLEGCYPVPYSSLSFLDKLVLLTLYKTNTDERFNFFNSIAERQAEKIFSPTDEMTIELMRELSGKNVLIVDPESEISAFKHENQFKSYFVDLVRWIPNVVISGDERASFSSLYREITQDLIVAISKEWENEICNVIFRIGREEVVQYLKVKADELNVFFSVKKKSREVITQLLQDFSVSGVYYFAKKAVESAHLFYSKGFSYGKEHAGNIIPGKMLNLGERALAEGWKPYEYNRDSRAPRSDISFILFDLILEDEDAGFKKPLGPYWKNELYPKYFSDNTNKTSGNIVCPECHSSSLRMDEEGLILTCVDCAEQFKMISVRK